MPTQPFYTVLHHSIADNKNNTLEIERKRKDYINFEE